MDDALDEAPAIEPQECSVVEPRDNPLDNLDWEVIERAIGPKPRAVVRLLVRYAQDVVILIVEGEPGEGNGLLNKCSQDAVAPKTKESTGFSLRLPLETRKTQLEPAARDP